MNTDEPDIVRRVLELRRSFDESFAKLHGRAESSAIDLLVLRVGAEEYAVRLREIAGFHVKKKIAGFPSPVPELLGLLATRGTLVPVYDLSALLGYSTSRTKATILLANQAHVAFACDAFECHLQVDPGAIAPAEHGRSNVDFVREFVQANGVSRPILDLASLVSAVRARARKAQALYPDKER